MMLFALLFTLPALADLPVKGDAVFFTSPRGVQESCVRIAKIPGGVFTPKDESTEAKLCANDIYKEEVAVCPKQWSTSPGTMFYSTKDTGLTQAQYEAERCGPKKGHKKLGKFKSTMNQSGTSATFSQSSLLYYHFSRYLNTTVQVPTAVYRSFDKDAHYERVAAKAKGDGEMNATAWKILRAAEKNPASYNPTREIFTPDLQLYGVLLDDGGGERYGAEINGIRSAWGDAQNKDFQNTPAFLALRSEKPFAVAVQEGIKAGRANKKMAGDLGSLDISDAQMGLWMKELTEITLLDYLFNQQDRVGNIDFEWYWIYAENGELKAKKEKREEYKDIARNKMKSITAPEELASFNPVLVQKSVINDNDAGGRPQYVNYTKRTKMLEGIRHYDAGTYRRLINLNKDFQAKGELYGHLTQAFYLSDEQAAKIVSNTAEAAKILQDTCRAGKLRFDLEFNAILAGKAAESAVDCLNP